MTTYNILIEGQTIPVPEAIGANDDAVRRSLAPYYPDAANAMITRTEKDEEGEKTITVNVIKKAGSKGAGLDYLLECNGGKNPAVLMYEQIQEMGGVDGLNPELLLGLDSQLQDAITEGEEQAEAVDFALRRLSAAAPHPAPVVVMGF